MELHNSRSSIPSDYEERVYAGVLGKIIGIEFGLPMEGWSYEEIQERLGDITGYTHKNLNNNCGCVMPCPNVSDDITGMFMSIRAMSDNQFRSDVTASDIGRTWLNYHIIGVTGQWWGAMGLSTERTAMVRLLNGIEAPRSGSMELNGPIVSQQIGGRIFVDSWAMVAPGDPELAADLARRAASVTHDGEGIYGAQMIAAMEALAFVCSDMEELLEAGLSVIPKDSLVYRATQDVREWHAGEANWRKVREKMNARYGYDTYGGACHMVPNHAVVIFGLLYGNGNFNKSMNITATVGLDTDCNCSAVGCILGIRDGLRAFDGTPDLRTCIRDRMYVSTTEGSRSVTDAVTEIYHIVNIGRMLAGEEPVAPKKGAKFHFDLPGSVQGFSRESGEISVEDVEIKNVEGHSAKGKRSLEIRFSGVSDTRFARVRTATFVPPEAIQALNRRRKPGSGWKYNLVASPKLYAGQTVRAGITADGNNTAAVMCRLYVRSYNQDDVLERTLGYEKMIMPGEECELSWRVPDMKGAPIAEVGIQIGAAEKLNGSVYLDYITWDGEADVNLVSPAVDNTLWDNAWVPAVQEFSVVDGVYWLAQDNGRGLIIQGTREWKDYRVTARLASQMATAYGIAARVQGHRRYYSFVMCRDNTLRIEKVIDRPRILTSVDFAWEPKSTYFQWDADGAYEMSMEVRGNTIVGFIDGVEMLRVVDDDNPLIGGGVAVLVEEGNVKTNTVIVKPLIGGRLNG